MRTGRQGSRPARTSGEGDVSQSILQGPVCCSLPITGQTTRGSAVAVSLGRGPRTQRAPPCPPGTFPRPAVPAPRTRLPPGRSAGLTSDAAPVPPPLGTPVGLFTSPPGCHPYGWAPCAPQPVPPGQPRHKIVSWCPGVRELPKVAPKLGRPCPAPPLGTSRCWMGADAVPSPPRPNSGHVLMPQPPSSRESSS